MLSLLLRNTPATSTAWGVPPIRTSGQALGLQLRMGFQWAGGWRASLVADVTGKTLLPTPVSHSAWFVWKRGQGGRKSSLSDFQYFFCPLTHFPLGIFSMSTFFLYFLVPHFQILIWNLYFDGISGQMSWSLTVVTKLLAKLAKAGLVKQTPGDSELSSRHLVRPFKFSLSFLLSMTSPDPVLTPKHSWSLAQWCWKILEFSGIVVKWGVIGKAEGLLIQGIKCRLNPESPTCPGSCLPNELPLGAGHNHLLPKCVEPSFTSGLFTLSAFPGHLLSLLFG